MDEGTSGRPWSGITGWAWASEIGVSALVIIEVASVVVGSLGGSDASAVLGWTTTTAIPVTLAVVVATFRVQHTLFPGRRYRQVHRETARTVALLESGGPVPDHDRSFAGRAVSWRLGADIRLAWLMVMLAGTQADAMVGPAGAVALGEHPVRLLGALCGVAACGLAVARSARWRTIIADVEPTVG